VEEEDVPPQAPEAEEVLQEDPGVAALPGLLRQRAGDDDGSHQDTSSALRRFPGMAWTGVVATSCQLVATTADRRMPFSRIPLRCSLAPLRGLPPQGFRPALAGRVKRGGQGSCLSPLQGASRCWALATQGG